MPLFRDLFDRSQLSSAAMQWVEAHLQGVQKKTLQSSDLDHTDFEMSLTEEFELRKQTNAHLFWKVVTAWEGIPERI